MATMTSTPSYPTFRDNPEMRGRFDDDAASNASFSGKRGLNEMYNKQEQQRGTEDASPKLRPSSLPNGGRMPPLQHQRSMSSPESDMYMQNEDFSCPICLHTIKEAFLGRCGHSYCYVCITGHLERKRDCPACGCPLMRDQIYPNFLLNRIIEKTPTTPGSPLDGTISPTTKHMRTAILASNFNADDINSMIVTLLAKKQRIESAEREAELDILSDFLSKVRAKKESKLMKLQQEIQCLNGDLYTIQEELKRITQKQKRAVVFDDETIADNGSVLIGVPSCNDSAESDVIDSYQHKEDMDMNVAESPSSLNSSPALKPTTVPENNEKLMAKKQRVLEHFEDLTDHYFSCRLNTSGYRSDDGLSDFCDSLSTFTHY
ncbi:5834_t:CDS:2, partial [Paraglomus occultum]